MGKEAKIGLAVILILLITFGVVLARRLTGSKNNPPASASKKNDQDGSKVRGDLLAKNGKSQTKTGGADKPTLVGVPSSSGKTSKQPSAGSDRWNTVSTSATTLRKTTSSPAKTSPPSYMPKPSLPASGDLYSQHQAGPTDASGSAGGSQAYDPFQNQTAQSGSGGTAQAGGGSNALRVIPSPAATARTAAGDGYPSSGRYMPAAQTAAPSPVHVQTSRPTYTPASTLSGQARQITASAGNSGIGPTSSTRDLRNEDGEYEVQPNDSYWVISEKLYGAGAYFKALAEHNRDRVPREDQLDVGDVISAPSISELEKAYPALCPEPGRGEILRQRASAVSTVSGFVGGRTYVVQEGDTLFDIARYELGKASRWPEILEMNRSVLGDDPNYISPGIRLALPEDEPVDTVTSRPGTGSTLRR